MAIIFIFSGAWLWMVDLQQAGVIGGWARDAGPLLLMNLFFAAVFADQPANTERNTNTLTLTLMWLTPPLHNPAQWTIIGACPAKTLQTAVLFVFKVRYYKRVAMF